MLNLRRLLAGLALLGATGATAVAQPQPVRIGLIEPQTGPVAFDGTSVIRGARLAAEEINKAGGVLGRPLELVIADGACRPADSVAAAERLITAEKVSVLMGAFCSGATQAVMPIAERNRLPLVTGVSSLPTLTEAGNRWFFRNAETDAMIAAAFAHGLVEQTKAKTVAFLAVNDDWGRGTVASFRGVFDKMNVTTSVSEFFDHSASDFYTPLTRLRSARPDLIIVVAETQAAATLVKQARELRIPSRIFGVGAWTTPTFLNLVGPAANGLLAGVAYTAAAPGDRNAAFVRDFRAMHNEDPGKYSASGYTTMNIIAQAIQRAGSTDAAAIQAALEQTDFTGPTGNLRFDNKHQIYGLQLYVVEIGNGRAEVRGTATLERND
ncbi:ABC transporter substrate-binding protein [Pararoseomonas indoligenes]|uniref:ABC transporter substrate-binding protein n=1 Tax=Roseomonas indoligenes TaxID=2820811 RepID=A0A940N3H4_9PROT|nr:ABC transporter substrate-binding protein [Pararoseomonas indoligenes]MBP0496080.1 ABC transporter substrate-binding protein [Pararoseomonas indoligenes]